jgi:hypothetical protein
MALLILTMASGSGLASDERLRAQVFPTFASAPAHVRIDAIVAPASENRLLEIVADSGTFYRSSAIQLSGADAARVYRIEFRSLPEGVYDVQVALKDGASRVRARVYYRVVIGESGDA